MATPSNVASLADQAFKKTTAKKRARPPGGGDVYDHVDYGRDGAKSSNFNLMLMLEEHPDWQGVFGYDEFANTVVKIKPMPTGGEAGPLKDHDCIHVSQWLSNPKNLGAGVRKNQAVEAIEGVAAKRRFHPVRDFLDRQVWDGEKRLERLFADFAGADFNEYTARIGVMLMVSAVARVYEPGCRVNFMLILEGKQQISKSDFIRQLFGPEWFAEAMESPAHKDFYQALIGVWGLEIAEMHAFSKADVTKVKQAITQPSDRYRRSYGTYAETILRQCVFVGTTNEDEYLGDPTGAARFLPVRVTSLEIDALKKARDQLWAEAAHLYRQGERYWVLPAQAEAEQEARYRTDSWEEPVSQWLEGKAPDLKYPAGLAGAIDKVTLTEVLSHALGVEIAKHTKQDQMRASAIMRRLRWSRQRSECTSGPRPWVWHRPAREGGS